MYSIILGQQPNNKMNPVRKRRILNPPKKVPTQVKEKPIVQEPLKQNTFVIIIPSFNNEQHYKRNLDSIVNQTYKNWRIIYIHDGSTDNTKKQVRYYSLGNQINDKVKVITNKKMMKQAYCYNSAFKQCKDDEICCLLEGNDWLYDNNVLERLNNLYNNEKILVTYGGMCKHQDGKLDDMLEIPDFTRQEVLNKEYRYSNRNYYHLCSGYASLFKSCPIEQLKDHNNEWLKCSANKAFMCYVLEQSKGKHMKVNFPTYVYNSCNYDDTNDESWEEYMRLVDERLRGFKKDNTLLKKRTFTNEMQQTFYDYLKQHDIGQILISPSSLQRFNRIKEIYGLQDYISENEPCLFFGVYVQNELESIKRHKGKKYVMFGGTDCDWRSTLSVSIMRILRRINDITYIAISKDIETRLKEPGVESTYLHLDLVNYNIFKPVDKEKERKCIYVYDGQGVITTVKKHVYNHRLIEEVKRKLPEYTYIHSSSLGEIPYEQMPSVYEKCFIGVRLTERDGNANTVQEFEAMDIPIIHNQSKYGLKWKNANDVIYNILNIDTKNKERFDLKSEKDYILIVLPTFNRSNNIENIINMINEQTYIYYNLLIIDDGSNKYHKNTFNNIKDKYKNYSKIIFKENNKNLNIPNTLNKGLRFY